MPPAMSRKPSSSGITLPKRAKSGGALAAGGSTASMTPAVRQRQLFHDVAAGVDHCADACRRRAKHRQAFLGRAQPRLGKVLRRTPGAEPGVVRGIEDEVGPVVLVDHVAGEDDFVAKVEADLAPFAAEIDRSRSGAGREVEVAGREARQADGRQERPHRQIFAIGDEVRLVVAADDLAARRERENAVGGACRRGCRRAIRRRARRSAGRHWDRERCRAYALERPPACCVPARCVLERVGDRRFWPQQQARLARGGPDSAARRRAASSSKPGPPLILLADVGLDDAGVADRERIGRHRQTREAATGRRSRRG